MTQVTLMTIAMPRTSRQAPFILLYVPAGTPSYFLGAHKSAEPVVEFYDATYSHCPLGQFVSSYYLETLQNAVEQGRGINLYGGVEQWQFDGIFAPAILAWLKMTNRPTITLDTEDKTLSLARHVMMETLYAVQPPYLPDPQETVEAHPHYLRIMKKDEDKTEFRTVLAVNEFAAYDSLSRDLKAEGIDAQIVSWRDTPVPTAE